MFGALIHMAQRMGTKKIGELQNGVLEDNEEDKWSKKLTNEEILERT
jgi:hypothetical protein